MTFSHTSSLAIDGRSLNQLKTTAATDPKAAVRDAARQFEAQFANMLLAEMRKTSFTDDDEFGKMFGASKNDTWRSMLDQQLTDQLSKQSGRSGSPLGLAPVIEKQLLQQLQSTPSDALVRSSPTMSTLDLARASLGANAAGAYSNNSRLELDGMPSRRSQFAPLQPAFEQLAGHATRRIQNGQFAHSTPSLVFNEQAYDDADIRHQFIKRFLPAAQHAESVTGIPAHFILGQAALESGWGRSEIKGSHGKPTHNLFGIKATGWSGPSSQNTTTEYLDGVKLTRQESFRAYASYEHAFADYAKLIANNPRYAGVVNAKRPQDFAYGLQRAGYATDPSYGDKLMQTIQQTSKLLVSGL